MKANSLAIESASSAVAPRESSAVNAWLVWLPGYLALGVAIGAAITNLSIIFLAPEFTVKLWAGLGVALGIAYCLRCGGSFLRETCLALLAVGLMMLPPALMSLGKFT